MYVVITFDKAGHLLLLKRMEENRKKRKSPSHKCRGASTTVDPGDHSIVTLRLRW